MSADPSQEQPAYPIQPRGVSRRSFLSRGAAAAITLPSMAAFLEACAKKSTTSGGSGPAPTAAFSVASPEHPVTWPIYPDNKPIASGLTPEKNATLNVYTYVDYFDKGAIKTFQEKYKEYNVKVQITTFEDTTTALGNIKTGAVQADIYNPSYDQIGKMVTAKLLAPLNHDYIPNISNVWPTYANPFYDQGWQYTVPYTIYTTGIAWRKDLVSENPYAMKNPWELLWQPKYKGRVAILDDYREGISLGLMKSGMYDLNTTDYRQIATSRKALQDLTSLVNVRIDNNDYTEVPSASTWIHHAWSGDMAAAGYYMPKGVPVSRVGYWFPSDGRGPVANDTNVVLRSAKNPVLAHMFLNYFLDLPNVLNNISFNGYMQPSNGVTPQVLVKEQILPPALLSTVVLPSYFRRGVAELQLPVDVDALWQQAWLVVSNGI